MWSQRAPWCCLANTTRPFSEGPSWRFGHTIQVCNPKIFWGHESDLSKMIQDGVIDVIGHIHPISCSVWECERPYVGIVRKYWNNHANSYVWFGWEPFNRNCIIWVCLKAGHHKIGFLMIMFPIWWYCPFLGTSNYLLYYYVGVCISYYIPQYPSALHCIQLYLIYHECPANIPSISIDIHFGILASQFLGKWGHVAAPYLGSYSRLVVQGVVLVLMIFGSRFHPVPY